MHRKSPDDSMCWFWHIAMLLVCECVNLQGKYWAPPEVQIDSNECRAAYSRALFMKKKQRSDHPVRLKTSTMLFYLLCCISAVNTCHHREHIHTHTQSKCHITTFIHLHSWYSNFILRSQIFKTRKTLIKFKWAKKWKPNWKQWGLYVTALTCTNPTLPLAAGVWSERSDTSHLVSQLLPWSLIHPVLHS